MLYRKESTIQYYTVLLMFIFLLLVSCFIKYYDYLHTLMDFEDFMALLRHIKRFFFDLLAIKQGTVEHYSALLYDWLRRQNLNLRPLGYEFSEYVFGMLVNFLKLF